MTDHITLAALQRALYRAADRQETATPDIWGAAPELRRAAFRLDALNTAQCNGVLRRSPDIGRMEARWTDADQARADRLRARAENRVRVALAQAFGPTWEEAFDLEFNQDPRGAPIRLHSATGAAHDLIVIW